MNIAKKLGLNKADFEIPDDHAQLLNQLAGLGANVIVKKVAHEAKSQGGIILSEKQVEPSTLGIVLKPNTFSYHNNGEPKEPALQAGDIVRFQRGNIGTTMPESPEGQEWVCIPESCIYYYSRLEESL